MEELPVLNMPSTHEKIEGAAVKLGKLLSNHPFYRSYMEAVSNLKHDPHVVELSSQLHAKRNALYTWDGGNLELAAEVKQIDSELEALPAIQAFRTAESALCPLFDSVNIIMSESLGVDFAANSKRGCGCGR